MPRPAAGVVILAILFAVPATFRAALTKLDEVLVFATPTPSWSYPRTPLNAISG